MLATNRKMINVVTCDVTHSVYINYSKAEIKNYSLKFQAHQFLKEYPSISVSFL